MPVATGSFFYTDADGVDHFVTAGSTVSDKKILEGRADLFRAEADVQPASGPRPPRRAA